MINSCEATASRKCAHCARSKVSRLAPLFLESRTWTVSRSVLSSTQLLFGVHRLDRVQVSRGVVVDAVALDPIIAITPPRRAVLTD
jgi:hypothetical protein